MLSVKLLDTVSVTDISHKTFSSVLFPSIATCQKGYKGWIETFQLNKIGEETGLARLRGKRSF